MDSDDWLAREVSKVLMGLAGRISGEGERSGETVWRQRSMEGASVKWCSECVARDGLAEERDLLERE